MILCLTHSNDYYTVDIVMKRFSELGIDTYRLNTDCFSDQLSFDYSINNTAATVTITDGDRTITLEEVTGVWHRKSWSIAVPEDLDDNFKSIYLQEYGTMRAIFMEALKQVPWFNRLSADIRIGNNKWEQLAAAAQQGIEIPKSLFTNNEEKVKSFFYQECGKQMIAKLHGSLAKSMSGATGFFPTTLIGESNLDGLAGLVYCPMIFQELIPKAYELRIIYINGIFFTGKINAGTSQRGKTDWRIATDVTLGWEVYTLPDTICTALTKMMQQLELFFGAIDMIRHTDGRYVFLEVNPQGEWGMLQRDLNYPIGETIAEQITAAVAVQQTALMND